MITALRHPLVALFAAAFLWATSAAAQDRDAVVQYSTLDALKAGLFDGQITYGEMARYGDFGVGTFNGIDGEMLGFGGRFWRIREDGRPEAVTPETETPFAVVTFFDRDRVFALPQGLDFKALAERLTGELPSANTPVAVMIHGRFPKLTVRAPRPKAPPYPTLAEALKDEVVWHLEDQTGTLAGFWFPAWLGGINAPVWHLHFLSDDHSRGGHVLDLTTGEGEVALDPTPRLTIILPESAGFDGADLSGR
ncbi:MAG: acetolactate decarboxylase [Rhodospirillaceae bacterium]|nr:acetolactate decarboxylase [Rhodospirillaceae bacterium]